MAPHRLLYVTEAEAFGGAERYIQLLLEGLDRSLYTPMVAHHPNAPSNFTDVLKDLNVDAFSLPPISGKSDLKRLWHQRNFFKTLQIDLIHFNLANPLHGQYSMLAANWAKVPYRFATMHLPPRKPTETWRAHWFEKQTLGKLNTLISVCHSSRNLILEHFGLSPGRVAVVYNGLNPDRFDLPHTVQNEFVSTPNTPIIGNIGRLTPQKGQDTLLDAAALVNKSHPSAKFIIVGTGPDKKKLAEQTQALGLSETVIFTGERSDIPEILASFDIFVLPSRYESFPVTTLEAMAAGLPVIVSDVDGASEAVTHNEHGLVVPKENAEALSSAIITLLDDTEKATQMGQLGKKRIQENFTLKHMVSQTEQVYQQALQNDA